MDLAQDTTSGDIYLVSGDLAVTLDQVDAIVQLVQQRLLFFQGEHFLDQLAGVPYMQSILGQKTPNPLLVDSALKLAILDTPGVSELLSFSAVIDNATRELQVSAKIRCVPNSTIVSFDTTVKV